MIIFRHLGPVSLYEYLNFCLWMLTFMPFFASCILKY